MTKKIGILSLITALLVLACGISDIPYLIAPTPSPFPTATAVPPTPSPQILPTHTATPTLTAPNTEVVATFPPPATATPADTATNTPVPPTGSPTPAATELVGTGFNAVNLSNNVFYFGFCQPTTVTFTVTVTNPVQIADLVLFTRFENKSTGFLTSWDKGVSMTLAGPGVYTRTLNSDHLGVTEDSWVHYQFVGTDSQGQVVARSIVYHDTLSLLHCP